MSIRNDYFPQAEASLKLWADIYKANLPGFAAALGIDPTELATLLTEAQDISSALDVKINARATYKTAIATSSAVIADREASLRETIAWIKQQPGFTDAIGQRLGIIAANTSFDPNTYQPEIISLAQTGPEAVEIKFRKRGVGAMNIYSRLPGATTWRKLGMSIIPSFTDETPLAQPGVPEMREYRLRGVVRADEVGEFSPIAQLPVM